MRYIIMDLEWNNTYARKTSGFINEVIEVGAVMLDENFKCVDVFSKIVKSQIGKKLRGNVKRLTHISNEDIKTGEPFMKVMSDFKGWIGDKDNVVLTWGDGDIRVLIENFRYFSGICTLNFMGNYMDLQRYFEIKHSIPKSQQISLVNAAEMVGIDVSDFSQHRALDDSLITSECLKKVYDSSDFKQYIVKCNSEFYDKLQFKPHAIGNINHPLVDKSILSYKCEKCGSAGEQITEWRFSNQFFRAVYHCPVCDTNVRVAVRFKKYFDRLETKKTITVIPTKKSGK